MCIYGNLLNTTIHDTGGKSVLLMEQMQKTLKTERYDAPLLQLLCSYKAVWHQFELTGDDVRRSKTLLRRNCSFLKGHISLKGHGLPKD